PCRGPSTKIQVRRQNSRRAFARFPKTLRASFVRVAQSPVGGETTPMRALGLACLLPKLIQLPRRFQQIQLCLLALEIRVQISHPLFVLIQPRLLHVPQIDLAFAELLLENADVELRKLQFQSRNLLGRVALLEVTRFLANLRTDLCFLAGERSLRGL